MMLIDADALSGQLNERLRCCNKGSVVEACLLAVLDIINSMPIVSPTPNDPLTLEELRGMGLFDWLWVEVVCPPRRQLFRKIESAYYQVFEDYTDGDALCCGWPGLIHEFEYEDYGKTWLAYRRRPEEGTT